MQTQVIPASKGKTVLLILGSAALVAASLWVLSLDAQSIAQQRRFNSTGIVYGAAWTGAIFFGFCGIVGIVRLFSSKPGLVMDHEGVHIMYLRRNQTVLWQDISAFAEYRVQKQKQILVMLSDPQSYINRYTGLAKWWIKTNYRLAGSPISLSSSLLKISHDDLIAQLTAHLVHYRQNQAV